jgi:hypothetical protein
MMVYEEGDFIEEKDSNGINRSYRRRRVLGKVLSF